MYLDMGKSFADRPETAAETALYHYIRELAGKSSQVAIDDYYRLLFHANAYPKQQVRDAIEEIINAPDADETAKYVINRCFYTIGNLWRLDSKRRGALRDLVARLEAVPASASNDPTTRRLRRYLHGYVESELYKPLKRQMRLLDETTDEQYDSSQNQLFGDDLKHLFFIQESVTITGDVPLSYRSSIRQKQAQIAQDTRVRISRYLASRRISPLEQVMNPTQILDSEVERAIHLYRPDRFNSCRSQARNFDQRYQSLQTIGELKQEICNYVLSPLIEANPKFGSNSFAHRFQRLLTTVDFSDAMPVCDMATTTILQRILQHLVIWDLDHQPEEFKNMICSVGYSPVTMVLLRIVLFWKRLRGWLEDRFGILFHLNEDKRKRDIEWVVQAFEHMNLALALNAKWLGYLHGY
jgi:hypothetical protein